MSRPEMNPAAQGGGSGAMLSQMKASSQMGAGGPTYNPDENLIHIGNPKTTMGGNISAGAFNLQIGEPLDNAIPGQQDAQSIGMGGNISNIATQKIDQITGNTFQAGLSGDIISSQAMDFESHSTPNIKAGPLVASQARG